MLGWWVFPDNEKVTIWHTSICNLIFNFWSYFQIWSHCVTTPCERLTSRVRYRPSWKPQRRHVTPSNIAKSQCVFFMSRLCMVSRHAGVAIKRIRGRNFCFQLSVVWVDVTNLRCQTAPRCLGNTAVVNNHRETNVLIEGPQHLGHRLFIVKITNGWLFKLRVEGQRYPFAADHG